ncbi:MAG: hybrid sensor histidine kinase/response regulator [Pseudomonadota bacterium]
MTSDNFSQFSMFELFRLEADNQVQVLTSGLLALERDPVDAAQLEQCMRAVHSLKGAARIVGITAGVNVAHVMEDCFVAAQHGRIVLVQRQIDLLLLGVDWLTRIAHTPEAELDKWSGDNSVEFDVYLSALQQVSAEKEDREVAIAIAPSSDAITASQTSIEPEQALPASDRMLRVTAENLNRLLGLAGESLVSSRWLKPFADSLLRLKRMQCTLGKTVEQLGNALQGQSLNEQATLALTEAHQRTHECQQFLLQRLVELELFSQRSNDLSQRLYDQALLSRMRPFADGVASFPRMVRDLGRSLGKTVKLEISGHATQVDRDILEKLDAPLTHLLRNAIDHGIETPDERLIAGKPAEGTIHLEARHSAGMLQITISDDGKGVALDLLRDRIVERQLINAATRDRLTEAELLKFLFLPSFTMKDHVSEISGRGVGLDVVQHMVKEVRGTVNVFTSLGQGTRFQLQLPLALSVVRALLVEIGGEPYAFPLAYVGRTLKLAKSRVEQLEGRQHFSLDGQRIGLVTAHQILQTAEPNPTEELAVVVVGDPAHPYGLIVDRLLDERELVVQPLDPRLGKIKDISAGALMEDGTPVLIIDVDDLVRSVDKVVAAGSLILARNEKPDAHVKTRKRVLVVDDSLTVRELERKLLDNHGYEVDIAVDGMDGWNALRVGNFDLIVTDVDMPRLDGIELVRMIRRDPLFKTLPVLIVSYKDRDEDRHRGLDAGADYYLAKSSFHDERLLDAVIDLIGEP